MRFTIRNTAPDTLCTSCVNSQVMLNTRGHRSILCHAGMQVLRVGYPLVECSSYAATGRMTQHEAEKIGWVLEKKGRASGFKPPKAEQ